MSDTTETGLPVLPEWLEEGVLNKFNRGLSSIASVFLLHGDVNCLVPNPEFDVEPQWPYIPLHGLLVRMFSNFETVIFYDIASGIRFCAHDPDPEVQREKEAEMEKEFRKIAELPGTEESEPGDPVAAAKAGLAAKRKLPTEPELCLPLIEKALSKMERVALVIESAHNIAPEQTTGVVLPSERTNIARIRSWAQDSRVKKRKNIVLLLADLKSKVSSELRQISSRIPDVFVPKPTPEERKFYLERLTLGSPEEQAVEKELVSLKAKFSRTKNATLAAELKEQIEELEEKLKTFPNHFEAPKDFDIDAFINATQGMSLRQILEMFRAAAQAKKPIDLSFVKTKKIEILNAEYGDVMEIVEPQWSLDSIGGLAKPKAEFAAIMESLRKGDIRSIPQGITIMGPPGTGKTALAEALAKGAQFNFVKMKNARSMWVGQSEDRTERQIQGLWALAPVIVMNDEADLGEANRDAPKGDSGVSERIMQAWMKFLSDPRIRGRVLFINCTNRPDRMDAAMKRSGRSDIRMPLLMPSIEEKAAIFEVMFKRYKIPHSISDFENVALDARGFSGADIEHVVLKSYRFAARADKKKVDDATLKDAILDFIPSASQGDIDLMTLLAISETSSRQLLPENTKEIILDIKRRNVAPGCAALIEQIESRNIVQLEEKLS